jgi:AAA family ATP:ADP antiporter
VVSRQELRVDRALSELERSTSTGRLHRAIGARPGELCRVTLSAAFFFVLLFGYFLLRPVREAMGVQRSMGDLRWLFASTCLVSLVVTLAFGGAVSRMNRRRFIPLAYRVVNVCLIGFAAMLLVAPDSMGLVTGYVFYVWLSVVNLFLVSVFWAFMADIWALDQAKRLFAAIGVGGTLGALAGSSVPWWLAEHLRPWMLMLMAAACFEIAVRFVVVLDRIDRPGRSIDEAGRASPSTGASDAWDGLRSIARSPYLAGVGGYIALMAISSTLIYFAKAAFVFDESDTLSEKISAFGQLDATAQGLTLIVQLFVTTRLIRRIGVAGTLIVLPAVTLAGFAALALAPAWGVLVLFQASHRATRYAIARPARETLFSVVTPGEKYQAKPVLDVFVYRAGDLTGMALTSVASIAAGGIGVMALAVAPVAGVWAGLAWWLGGAQGRRRGVPVRSGSTTASVTSHASVQEGTTV